MSANIYTITFFAAVFFPVIVFSLVAAFTSPSRTAAASGRDLSLIDQEELLLSGRGVTEGHFVSSTVAYMLQVSTTFYFVYWGYNYGFSNIWYMVSWAVGILIFSQFSLALYKTRDVGIETAPSVLSGGKPTLVRKLASLATLASFLGVFYVEVYFTSDFVIILSNPTDAEADPSVWWIFFGTLAIVTVLYSVLGGLRKVVATDTYQLSFAYIGLAVVFSFLIPKGFAASPSSGQVIGLLTCGLYGALLVIDSIQRKASGTGSNFKTFSLALSAALCVGSYLYGATRLSSGDATFLIAGPFAQVREDWGWVTLLGFTLINLSWQFCDNSNYQRINALQLSADQNAGAKQLRRALRGLILVSPLTWGLGILLGMLIKTSGIIPPGPGTEYVTLLQFLKDAALAGDFFAYAAVLCLAVALVSIMMSTADSAIIAAFHSFSRDLAPKVAVTRWTQYIVSAVCLLLIFGLAVVHRAFPDASILTVMAGVYSAIIVLVWSILLTLNGRSIPASAVMGSIALGTVATWWFTFSPPLALPWNVQIVAPFFAALFGSLIPLVPCILKMVWQQR